MIKNTQENPPGKGFGKAMWIATWVVAMGLLTLYFGEREKSWLNPNQNPQSQVRLDGSREVLLQRNRSGHYVASGKINGKTAEFLLDTGATDVAVSAELAQHFGLIRGRKGIAATANGNVTVFQTRIDILEIGDIQLENVRASINPSMGNFILLGMSALKQVEFIQRGDTLTLRQLN